MSFISTPDPFSQVRSYTVQVPTEVTIKFHIEEIATGSRIFATYSLDSDAGYLEDAATRSIQVGSGRKIRSTEIMDSKSALDIWKKYILPGTSESTLDLATGRVYIPFRARANSI